MANVDAAFGLRPCGHLLGIPWNAALEKCYVHANYATALFVGDPVDLDTTDANLDSTGMHPTVIAATAGDGGIIYGVIVGIEPIRTDLSKQYIPASTGGYVYVCRDPYVIFQVQDDGDGTPAATWIGANAILQSGSGSTVTGKSAWELDASTTPAANDSYQLVILRLANLPNNSLGDNAIWEVLINMHRLKPNSTGDGTAVGALGVL